MSRPPLGRLIDERFLMHRLRSTSLAGVIGGCTAILLFAYRYFIDHRWSSDLLSIGVIIVAVKLTALAWYRWTD